MTQETRKKIDMFCNSVITDEGITFEEQLDSLLRCLYRSNEITGTEYITEYEKYFPR
jgi:hypothetical protein